MHTSQQILGPQIEGRSARAHWIDTDSALHQLVEVLRNDDSLAIDTEFHREKTYYPRLALIQVARASGEIALIDPFRVELKALLPLFDSSIEFIFHAFDQDLAILERAVGAVPKRLYDTQIAAAFLGTARAGLGTLLEKFLAVKAQKADRFSDWTLRPLSKGQIDYASTDVVHLHSLRYAINKELIRLGRVRWVDEELQRTLERQHKLVEPELAWLRIKECRTLDEQSKRVARALGTWRELTARENDIPCRYVLSDLAVATIAHAKPRSLDVMLNLRGVDSNRMSSKIQTEIMETIKAGLSSPVPAESISDGAPYPKHLTPLVQLCQAWVTSVAQQAQIDSVIVSSKDDIQDLLAKKEHARLRSGWRYELVGKDITDLIEGRSAIRVQRQESLETFPLDTP